MDKKLLISYSSSSEDEIAVSNVSEINVAMLLSIFQATTLQDVVASWGVVAFSWLVMSAR